MIKKHTGAHKLVNEFTGGDPNPTWEDRLKNQQGYGRTSSVARMLPNKAHKAETQSAEQVLADLGKKTFTENDSAEVAEDRAVSKGKKII